MDGQNPFDEIERLLDRMSEGLGEEMFDVTGGSVPVDVEDRENEYVVTADLPGYDREDLTVELLDGRLRVGADAEAAAEEDRTGPGGRYIRRERRRSSVSRTVSLPGAIEESAVEASYANGVLTVTLPKAGGDGATSIDIE